MGGASAAAPRRPIPHSCRQQSGALGLKWTQSPSSRICGFPLCPAHGHPPHSIPPEAPIEPWEWQSAKEPKGQEVRGAQQPWSEPALARYVPGLCPGSSSPFHLSSRPRKMILLRVEEETEMQGPADTLRTRGLPDLWQLPWIPKSPAQRFRIHVATSSGTNSRTATLINWTRSSKRERS